MFQMPGMRTLILLPQDAPSRRLFQKIDDEQIAADIFHSQHEALNALRDQDYGVLLRLFRDADTNCLDWLRQINCCQATRRPSCLILSSKEAERIIALDAGADDAVCQTASPAEIVARLRRLARIPCRTQDKKCTYGDVTFCARLREIRVGNEPLPMQPRETAILALLLQRGGIPVACSGIGSVIYGNGFSENRNSIEVRISRIRRSLRQAASKLTIETVRGVGYRLIEA